jgi:hypothetical protein
MADFAFSLSLLPHREITFKNLEKTEFLKETIQTMEAWGFRASGGWFEFIRNLEDGTLKDIVLTSKTGIITLEAEEIDSELKVRYRYTWLGKHPKIVKEKLVSYSFILVTAIATLMTAPLPFIALGLFLDLGAQGFLEYCCIAFICWIPAIYVQYLTYQMYKKIFFMVGFDEVGHIETF